MRYIGLGSEIAASLAIPLFIGYWCDQSFGTDPWGILIGIFLGLALLFYSFYKMYKKLFNSSSEK